MRARNPRRLLGAITVALTWLVWSPTLLACPVCFGQSDAPMATGMNAGVLVLLGITLSVLAIIAAHFFVFSRRLRIAAHAMPVETLIMRERES